MEPENKDTEVELAQLRKEERSISARRTRLHNRIDFLRAGGGHPAQDADLIAELERQERELSEQRRALHEQIELASAKLSQSGV